MGKRSDTGSRSEKSCCCKVLASESHNNHTNKTSLFIPRAPRTPPPPASTSPHHITPSPPTSALNRSPQFLSAPCSVSTKPALPLQSVPSHPIGPPHHHHTTTTTPSSRLSHAHMQPRKRARLDREIRDRETVKLPLIPHCSCTPLPRIPPVDDHRSIVHRLDDDGDDQGGDGFNGIDCFVCLTLCCLLCMF